MVKVTVRYGDKGSRPVFICDFSPPRGGDPALLDMAKHLDADFLCVGYNPGKSVRVDSAMAAHVIKQQTGKEVVFTLATRDMNRLAIQSHLLGASLLGLENVIVVGGDPFTQVDLATVKAVNDFNSTELIAAVKFMNEGLDYRGLKLRSPTDFCVGAAIDLGRGIEKETLLAHRKASAGADFLVTQPVYDLDQMERFQESYESLPGGRASVPIFFGLHVLAVNSTAFGDVPERFRRDLDKGRSGTDIAIELLHGFLARGITHIYLVSPVLRGGRRDYPAAQRVLEASKGL